MTDDAIEKLVARLRAGDEAAAGELYRAFEPFLRGLVRRRMPGQARARFDSLDVVQSAWASLLDGLREDRWKFTDASHVRAFLARVVLCRLYDRGRTVLLQTAREEPLAGVGPTLAAPDPRPSEQVRASATWETLLSACPPEYQPIIRLRRDGHSCEEIGERMGLHPGSIRRILRQLARRVAFDVD